MGKLIPLLFAGAGTATVSVGGFYLVKNFGRGDDVQLEFEDLDSFISQPTKSKCVKDYFSTLENVNQIQEMDTNNKPTDGEFFSTTAENSAIKSCLKIEYKKTIYKENKWTGKFTWLWAFVRGNEGFISFNIAEPSAESNKLKFTGIFYLVKKKTNEENKWEIKYKKSVTGEDKKTDKTTLDTYFPKASNDLKTSSGIGDYWGFLDSNEDLGNICSGGGCKPADGTVSPPIKKEFNWTKGDDSEKFLKDWAVDLNWWATFYTNGNWALASKISSYKGTWTKVQKIQS